MPRWCIYIYIYIHQRCRIWRDRPQGFCCLRATLMLKSSILVLIEGETPFLKTAIRFAPMEGADWNLNVEVKLSTWFSSHSSKYILLCHTVLLYVYVVLCKHISTLRCVVCNVVQIHEITNHYTLDVEPPLFYCNSLNPGPNHCFTKSLH